MTQTNDKLQQLIGLIDMMREAEQNVADIELALKAANKVLTNLSQEAIPMLMAELNLTKLTLEDGSEVSIKNDVYASITDANRTKAFSWLRANDHEDLIKNELKVNFGKGENALALKAIEFINSLGKEYDLKESVNAQTLKAFLRKELSSDNSKVDLDAFNAQPVWVTKVNSPRPTNKKKGS